MKNVKIILRVNPEKKERKPTYPPNYLPACLPTYIHTYINWCSNFLDFFSFGLGYVTIFSFALNWTYHIVTFYRVGKFFFEKLSLTFRRFLYDFPWLQVSKPYDFPWLSWENIYLSLTQVQELKLEEKPLTWKWFINLGNNLIETRKKINSGGKTNWFLLK